LVEEVVDIDVLIVGSEGAGAMAAIEASKSKLRIAVVTKGRFGKSGATLTGGAAICVDGRSLHDLGFKGVNINDNKDLLFEDMVKVGKFMNNQKLVEIHVNDAPDRLKDLIEWGADLDLRFWPTVMVTSSSAYPRSAFMEGEKVSKILKDQVMKSGVEVKEFIMITDLLVHDNKVSGAVGINILTGDFLIFRAKAIILATGGTSEIYPYSTTTVEQTGDGHSMAYRAGAELIDMEFPIFWPGVFAWPTALKGNLFPTHFILYNPGWLLNKNGERFMKRWDPENMELTSRDITSIAIMSEILEGRGSPHGGVYLSFKHLPDNLIDYIKECDIDKNWMYGTLDMNAFMPDLHKEALEVTVACHYHNGGIKIDENCKTNIQGLFAAGEATGGVHGVCRLGGNAFTDFLVWGHRAGRAAAEHAAKTRAMEVDGKEVERLRKRVSLPIERDQGTSPIELKRQIQSLAWEKVGVIKAGTELEEAVGEIKKLRKAITQISVTNKDCVFNREWMQALEVENMLLLLEMHAQAGLMRTESRGSHYRKDYPNTDNRNWLANIIIRQVGGEMSLITRPVVVTKLKPPTEVTPYLKHA
jgi:succinate dehydrogenase/fumarate reductase flavoprotein subunit